MHVKGKGERKTSRFLPRAAEWMMVYLAELVCRKNSKIYVTHVDLKVEITNKLIQPPSVYK